MSGQHQSGVICESGHTKPHIGCMDCWCPRGKRKEVDPKNDPVLNALNHCVKGREKVRQAIEPLQEDLKQLSKEALKLDSNDLASLAVRNIVSRLGRDMEQLDRTMAEWTKKE